MYGFVQKQDLSVTRGRQKSLLTSVESKLSECCRWLDSIKETQADQPVMTEFTDYQQHLAQIQVTADTMFGTELSFSFPALLMCCTNLCLNS